MQAEANVENINRSLLTLKRRVFMGVVLSSLLYGLITSNLLAGMAVMIGARLGYSLSVFMLAAFGFILAATYALTRAYKLRPDAPRGLAILDAYNNAGGLILSVVETRDVDWCGRLPDKINVPEVKVNYRSQLPLFLASIVFAVLCFFTPVLQADLSHVAVLDFNQISAQAQESIALFEETGILNSEEALRLEEQLSAISEAADSYDPAKTFEALDQMAQKLQLLKQIGANDFRDRFEQLEKSLTAIESMQNLNSDNSQESQSAQSLLQQINKLDALNDEGQMNKALAPLQEALNGAPEEKSIEQAVTDLKDYITREREKALQNLQKLVEEQAIDTETMKQIIGQTGQEGQGEGSLTDGQTTIMSPTDSDGQQPSGKAGKSEPWMTVPLDSNRVTSEHSMKYKDETLTAPALDSLDSAVVTGMAISAPLAESAKIRSDFRHIGWNNPDGNAADANLLLPKHRNTVKNYFNRCRDRSKQ